MTTGTEHSIEDMAEILASEGLVKAADVCGRPWSTVRRWIAQGCHGVRLEAILDGGIWMTSRQALARFRARLTGQPVARIETQTELERQAAWARAEKDKLRQQRKGGK